MVGCVCVCVFVAQDLENGIVARVQDPLNTPMNYDVLANTIRTWITIFRMVAEQAVHRAVRLHGRRHKEQRVTEQGLHCNYRVISALLVEPTYMDQTSVSTTTWSAGSINMHSLPKQTSHKRDLPATFEGNKPNEQQGPTTTFKNWAAEVQIYMSLEDHNLANILEDTKTQKQSIVDAHYIDYYLQQQGL
eukprot:57299-Amphidinium_carterae.3